MNNLSSPNSQFVASQNIQARGTRMGLLPSPMVKSEQLASALPATRGVRKRAPKNQEGAGGRKARRIWSHEEDITLQKLVSEHVFDESTKNHWARIADKMNKDKPKSDHRSGKQCRDRWQNHLRSDIKKGAWTKEEEQLIRDMHKAFGTKWSCMAKLMKNRTDNDIKNKWYSMVRSEKKAMERIQEPTSHESFAQSHVKMGDQNKRNQDLSIPKSLNAETGSQGVMNWQGEATVYETVPYDANGIAPKPNDLFLFPMMASGSLSGWTFGQTRLNSSNFNNPIAGFAASPTAGAPIPIAFPQMGPTGMDGVMSFDKDTSDPDMDMKMAAIDTDTNMPAIKYGQVQSSHGRNGFRENQGDSPNIDGTKGAFRAI